MRSVQPEEVVEVRLRCLKWREVVGPVCAGEDIAALIVLWTAALSGSWICSSRPVRIRPGSASRRAVAKDCILARPERLPRSFTMSSDPWFKLKITEPSSAANR